MEREYAGQAGLALHGPTAELLGQCVRLDGIGGPVFPTATSVAKRRFVEGYSQSLADACVNTDRWLPMGRGSARWVRLV